MTSERATGRRGARAWAARATVAAVFFAVAAWGGGGWRGAGGSSAMACPTCQLAVQAPGAGADLTMHTPGALPLRSARAPFNASVLVLLAAPMFAAGLGLVGAVVGTLRPRL